MCSFVWHNNKQNEPNVFSVPFRKKRRKKHLWLEFLGKDWILIYTKSRVNLIFIFLRTPSTQIFLTSAILKNICQQNLHIFKTILLALQLTNKKTHKNINCWFHIEPSQTKFSTNPELNSQQVLIGQLLIQWLNSTKYVHLLFQAKYQVMITMIVNTYFFKYWIIETWWHLNWIWFFAHLFWFFNGLYGFSLV